MAAGAPILHSGRWPLLPRPRLSARVLETPPGGVCLLTTRPGFGRRSLLAQTIHDPVTVVELPHDQDAWTAVPTPWLVLLDADRSRDHEQLSALMRALERRDSPARAAITTSVDLASLEPLRRRGLVVDLDEDDLALTDAEARTLLSHIAADLPASTAAEAVRLCDGWSAALVAVGERHAAHPDRDLTTWLRTRGAEGLVAAWWDELDPGTQEMLLDTAVLERLTPDLVDAVSTSGHGARLVELARPHGMIRVAEQQPDAEHIWFERHPLLTAVVRYRAGTRPGELDRHRQAARWNRSRGELEPELRHLLLAGDTDEVARRLHEHEHDLLATGRADTAQRWYSARRTDRSAEQLLREAWANALADRVPEANAALQLLRAALGRDDREDPFPHPGLRDLRAESDVVEAWLAERRGDARAMQRAARSARDAFGLSWDSNSPQLAALLLARSLQLLGDPTSAAAVLESVRDNVYAAAVLGEGRRCRTEAAVAWDLGHVHEARMWAARYDQWLRSQDSGQLHARTLPSVTEALCAAEAGRPVAAADSLDAIARRTADAGSVSDQVEALLGLAALDLVRWRLGPGLAHASQARELILLHAPNGGLLPRVTTVQTRLRLLAGDLVRAERLLRDVPPGVARQLLHARLALHRGRPAGVTLVRDIEPTCVRQQVELSLLDAWSSLATSRSRAEHQVLRAAELAGANGLTTALVDAPEELLTFAAQVARQQVHDPLITLVRTAARTRTERRAMADDRAPSPSLVDRSLTRGDLQLLALLPTRPPYAAIATELGISVNTVKTRLRRLYAKLGVHDRDAAIDVATRLGLVAGRRSL
jgi:LuxR family maltose regulon positive regulatory protein